MKPTFLWLVAILVLLSEEVVGYVDDQDCLTADVLPFDNTQSVKFSLVDSPYFKVYCGLGDSHSLRNGKWFQFQGNDQQVVLRTCDAYTPQDLDTQILVLSHLSPQTCDSYEEPFCVAYNDDAPTGTPLCAEYQSYVSFCADSSSHYYVYVNAWTDLNFVGLVAQETGPCSVVKPTNTDCTKAKEVLNPGKTFQETVSTLYVPVQQLISNDLGAALWYSFPGRNDMVKFTTCTTETNLDTVFMVLEKSQAQALDCSTLPQHAYHDDDNGACGYQTTMFTCAYNTKVYYLAAYGYETERGTYTLKGQRLGIACYLGGHINSLCNSAVPVNLTNPQPIGFMVKNFLTMQDNFPNCGEYRYTNGLWFRVIGTGKRIKVSNANEESSESISSIDVFRVSGDCSSTFQCETLVSRSTNYAFRNGGTALEKEFCTLQGVTYYIWVGINSDFSYKIDFSVVDSPCPVNPPVNSQCSNAQDVDLSNGPVVLTGTTVDASYFPIPSAWRCNSYDVGENGVWYHFQGNDFDVRITLNTAIESRIYIFEHYTLDPPCTNFYCVSVRHSSLFTTQSSASVCTYSGWDYYVFIGLKNESSFTVKFAQNLLCVGGNAPPNNDCNQAQNVALNSPILGSTRFTKTAVFTNQDVQCSVFRAGTDGVWYTFIGTGVAITATTCDASTELDTRIHVFTQNPAFVGCFTNFTCETFNDDSCVVSPYASTAVFCALVGVRYYVFVDGYSGETGEFNLTLKTGAPCNGPIVPPNDQCVKALPISTAIVKGTTLGARSTNFNGLSMGSCPASSWQPPLAWYSIQGSETRMVRIDYSLDALDFGSQLWVFSQKNTEPKCNLNELSCEDYSSSGSTEICIRRGRSYFVSFGGFYETAGDFTLHYYEQIVTAIQVPSTIVNPLNATTFQISGIPCVSSQYYPDLNYEAWYSFEGTGGPITISTCNPGTSVFQHGLSVFGSSLDVSVCYEDLSCVVTDTFDKNCSTVSFCSGLNVKYLVAVRSDTPGTVKLSVDSSNPNGLSCALQDCCVSSEVPGCVDSAVAECVCSDYYFFYCCSTKWSEGCISEANNYCTYCPTNYLYVLSSEDCDYYNTCTDFDYPCASLAYAQYITNPGDTVVIGYSSYDDPWVYSLLPLSGTQNMILTFTNINNDFIPAVTQAATEFRILLYCFPKNDKCYSAAYPCFVMSGSSQLTFSNSVSNTDLITVNFIPDFGVRIIESATWIVSNLKRNIPDFTGAVFTIQSNFTLTNFGVFQINNSQFRCAALQMNETASGVVVDSRFYAQQWELDGNSTVQFSNSSIAVFFSFVELNDEAVAVFRQQSAIVRDNLNRFQLDDEPPLRLYGNSRMSIYDSEISLAVGISCLMSNNSIMTLDDQSELVIGIEDKTFCESLKNFSNIFNCDKDLVNSLTQRGSSHSTITNSKVHLFGGDVFIQENAFMEFLTGSKLEIDVGTFHANGSSKVQLNQAELEILEGDLLVEGDCSFSMSESYANVSGGNAVFYGDCRGELDDSTLIVSSGEVDFSNFTQVNMETSRITVLDGSVKLMEEALLEMNAESELEVSSGIVELFDDSAVEAISSSIRVTGGSLFMNDSAKLTLNSDAHLVVSEGSLNCGNMSKVSCSDHSFVNVTGGNVNFQETSLMNVISSLMRITGGSVLLDDFSRMLLNSAGQLFVSGGSFSGSVESEIICANSSSVNVTDGDVTLHDSAEMQFVSSNMGITGGSVLLYNQGKLSLNSKGQLYISGGSLIAANASEVGCSENSLVNVTGGNVVFQNTSIMTLVTSSMGITGGSVMLQEVGKISLKQSGEIFIGGGSLSGVNGSVVSCTNSSWIKIAGGNVTFVDSTLMEVIYGSNMRISGGSVSFSFSSRLRICYNSTLRMDGGTLAILDKALLEFCNDSTIDLTNGNVILAGDGEIIRIIGGIFSLINLAGSTNGGNFTLGGRRELHLLDGALLIISGGNLLQIDSSIFRAFPGTSVRIDSGSLSFDQNTRSFIIGAKITVNGGNAIFCGNHVSAITEGGALAVSKGAILICGYTIVSMNASSASVVGGDLVVTDFAKLLMTSLSEFIVTSGNFKLTKQALLELTLTQGRISGGSVILKDSSIMKMNALSSLLISGGDFQIIDSASIQAFFPLLIAISGGSVLLNGFGSVDLITTPIMITGGSFKSGGISKQNLKQQSKIKVDFGEVVYEGAAQALIVQSTVQVSGGNLRVDGTSLVSLQGNSIFQVLAGSFLSNGFSRFISQSQSILAIAGGNAIFSGLSSSELSSSIVSITGGILSFSGNHQSELQWAADITIQAGNFIVTEFSLTKISKASSVKISGGNLQIFGQGKLVMDGGANFFIALGNFQLDQYSYGVLSGLSSGLISGGQVIVNGLSSLHIITGSSLRVTGGMIGTYGLSQMMVLGGLLAVAGGRISSGGTSKMLISSGSILRVDSGSLEFNEASISIIENLARAEVNGGLITFNSLSNVIISNGGQMSMSAGSVNIGGASKLLMSFGSLSVQGGTLIITDFSNVDVRQSSIAVTIGNIRIGGVGQVTVIGGSLSLLGSIGFPFQRFRRRTKRFFGTIPSGGVFQLEGYRTLYLSLNSKLTVSGGTLNIKDFSQLIALPSTQISITAGSVNLLDFSKSFLSSTQLTVSGGNLVFGNSHISSISGLAALIAVSGGSVLVTGIVKVDISDSAAVTVSAGTMQISSLAELAARNGASIKVLGGNFMVDSGAKLLVFSANTQISGGSVILSGYSSSEVQGFSALLTVAGGSLQITNNAKCSVSMGGKIAITAGTVTLDGTSSLQLTGQSRLDVSGGTLQLNSLASLKLSLQSEVSLSGGNIYLSGDFAAQPVVIDNSNFKLNGALFVSSLVGMFQITGERQVILVNQAKIAVGGGSLSINQRAKLIANTGTSVEVSLGNLDVTDSGELNAKTAAISVSGGNFHVGGNAKFSLTENGQFSISSGSFVADGTAKVLLDGSTGTISGGRFAFSGYSSLEMITDSTVRVTNGDVNLETQGEIVLGRNCFIYNENRIVAQGTFVVPESSGITIESNGIMEMGDSDFLPSSRKSKRDTQQAQTGGKLTNKGALSIGAKQSSKSLREVEQKTGVSTGKLNQYKVPVENAGKLTVGSKTSFGSLTQKAGSLLLEETEIHVDSPLDMQGGELSGVGKVVGSIKNTGAKLTQDKSSGTLLEVEGDYEQSGGSLAVPITGTKAGSGFTKLSVKGNADLQEGASISVCLQTALTSKSKLTIVEASKVTGKFSSVDIGCGSKTKRHVRNLELLEEEQEDGCHPQIVYEKNSISIVVGPCNM